MNFDLFSIAKTSPVELKLVAFYDSLDRYHKEDFVIQILVFFSYIL